MRGPWSRGMPSDMTPTQPPGGDEPLEPPHYRAERVRDALAHDDRVNELDVQVKITGTKVFVTGNVATQERRAAISTVVEEILPDHQVVNETTLLRLQETDESEELA